MSKYCLLFGLTIVYIYAIRLCFIQQIVPYIIHGLCRIIINEPNILAKPQCIVGNMQRYGSPYLDLLYSYNIVGLVTTYFRSLTHILLNF